ncbi:unnamed protein product [Rotaria socialis]
MSQKSLSSTPRILNNAEQYFAQEEDKNKLVSGKTVGRQFHPHQRHYGYGSIQAINSPFSGSGVGLYQYGYGEYGQLGQGSGQYAAYYNNRYPGSYGFYPGFNSVGYYGSNNHAPPVNSSSLFLCKYLYYHVSFILRDFIPPILRLSLREICV